MNTYKPACADFQMTTGIIYKARNGSGPGPANNYMHKSAHTIHTNAHENAHANTHTNAHTDTNTIQCNTNTIQIQINIHIQMQYNTIQI